MDATVGAVIAVAVVVFGKGVWGREGKGVGGYEVGVLIVEICRMPADHTK